MTLVLTVPGGVPGQLVNLLDASQTSLRGQVADFDLPSCIAVAGLSTADIRAAIATGTPEVCFPPGVYDVTGLISQELPYQVLNFQPGAVLRFAASGLGRLVLGGAYAAIIGMPRLRFDAASSAAYIAVDLAGSGCSCVDTYVEVNDNITNATVFRQSGDYSRLGNVLETGVGEFDKLVEWAHADDSEVDEVTTGRIDWRPVDDGSTTRNFGTVLRMKGKNACSSGGIACNTGGRTFINQVFDQAGHTAAIYNPQVFCLKALWGLRIRDGAEFLEIFGGQFHQAAGTGVRAGSQGIELGEGSFKGHGTKVIGWDFGVRFTGSCDTCDLFGMVIANNNSANLEIDSGASPVSGLGLFGCYFECEANPQCINIHLKTGQALGFHITGGQQGWGAASPTPAADVSILAEAAFGATDCWIAGVRFQGSNPTDAFTQPNTNTKFLFGPYDQFGTNLLGKGAFAANAVQVRDPVLQGVVIGTRDTGTANNHLTKVITDIYTANFGTVGAGASVDLNFNYAGVPAVATASLVPTMDATLRAKATAGIVFTWAIDSSGHIGGTAFNPTAAPINAVAGGVRFLIFATS